jgi:hypothetical protein
MVNLHLKGVTADPGVPEAPVVCLARDGAVHGKIAHLTRVQWHIATQHSVHTTDSTFALSALGCNEVPLRKNDVRESIVVEEDLNRHKKGASARRKSAHGFNSVQPPRCTFNRMHTQGEVKRRLCHTRRQHRNTLRVQQATAVSLFDFLKKHKLTARWREFLVPFSCSWVRNEHDPRSWYLP